MKKLLLIIPTVFIFNACSTVDGASPSQNKAVNAVAGKKETKEPGAMQKALDRWLKEEWEPATAGDAKPTANTKVKVVEQKDGTAELVEVKSGKVLKKMSKEEVVRQKEVKQKYKEKDRHFTLQEYVDKLSVYSSTHVTDDSKSHNKKLESMPVIGKSRR
jgi:hypothetical protein